MQNGFISKLKNWIGSFYNDGRLPVKYGILFLILCAFYFFLPYSFDDWVRGRYLPVKLVQKLYRALFREPADPWLD